MGKDYIQNLASKDGKTQQEEAVASLIQVLFSSTEFRFIE